MLKTAVSPYINRFLQPDTVIPDLSSPQSWNRFAYANNSPVNLNDPTGHDAISTCGGNSACMGYVKKNPIYVDNFDLSMGIKFSGSWTGTEKIATRKGVLKIDNALKKINSDNSFNEAFEDVTFNRTANAGYTCEGGAHTVTCAADADITDRFMMHELGHSFDLTNKYAGTYAIEHASINTNESEWVTGLHTDNHHQVWDRGLDGYPNTSGTYGVPDLYHGPGNWKDWNKLYDKKGNYTGVAYTEEWGDMFLNWADGSFVGDAGKARKAWVNMQINNILNPSVNGAR